MKSGSLREIVPIGGQDAKRYAAALLMPGKALSASAERVYAELVRQAGTDNAAAVKKGLPLPVDEGV